MGDADGNTEVGANDVWIGAPGVPGVEVFCVGEVSVVDVARPEGVFVQALVDIGEGELMGALGGVGVRVGVGFGLFVFVGFLVGFAT